MGAGQHRENGRIRPRNIGLLSVARDIALLIIVVIVFALFHHVLSPKPAPAEGRSVETGTESISPSALQPEAVANAFAQEAAAASTATHAPGDFSAAFPAGDAGKDRCTAIRRIR